MTDPAAGVRNLAEAMRLLYDARTVLEIGKLDLSDDAADTVSAICSELSEFRRQLGAVAKRYEGGQS